MNLLAPEYPICRLSALLGVSRAGFYRTNGQGPRAQSDGELVEEIRNVYEEHKQRYGSPRVQIELKRRGTVCGTNRVARLMREEGLKGISAPRKHPQTTDSNHGGPIAPNLLGRHIASGSLNLVASEQ